MGTCRNCKFWLQGTCDLEGHLDPEEGVTNGFAVNVTADDDSGLSGEFITGPDFGCIH